MLVLPGGMPGTRHLGAYKPLTDMLCDWDTKGKQLAAICAAPSVFGDLGILNGKEAVCYPGFEERLTGATIGEGTVAVTDHVITSRGMGTAIDFAAALIARLQDEKKAEEIKHLLFTDSNAVMEACTFPREIVQRVLKIRKKPLKPQKKLAFLKGL